MRSRHDLGDGSSVLEQLLETVGATAAGNLEGRSTLCLTGPSHISRTMVTFAKLCLDSVAKLWLPYCLQSTLDDY